MKEETSTLWRIRRTEEPAAERPQEPIVVGLYGFQQLAVAAGVAGLAAIGLWLGSRWREKRRSAWARVQATAKQH